MKRKEAKKKRLREEDSESPLNHSVSQHLGFGLVGAPAEKLEKPPGLATHRDCEMINGVV